MPSYSIGFCVARTRNGGSSACVVPSIETCRSCIASSSAAWVFGGARLISSARRTFAKTGPGRNSKVASRWFQIDEPGDVRGEQVGRELHAREAEARDRGERAGGQRLREPGHVLEQHVAVGEQAREDELEALALADDGTLDLVEDGAGALARARSAPREPLQAVDGPLDGVERERRARRDLGERDGRAARAPRHRARGAPRRAPASGRDRRRAGAGRPTRSSAAAAGGGSARRTPCRSRA